MNRLRELREEKKYSLRKLGEDVNINASVLGNYERGDRQPKIEVWEKLADYFGVTTAYIMGISPIKEPTNLFSLDRDDLSKQNKEVLDEVNSFVVDMLDSNNGWTAIQAQELFSNVNQILKIAKQSDYNFSPLTLLTFFSSLVKEISIGSFFTDGTGNILDQSKITTKYLTSREQVAQKLDAVFTDQINRQNRK